MQPTPGNFSILNLCTLLPILVILPTISCPTIWDIFLLPFTAHLVYIRVTDATVVNCYINISAPTARRSNFHGANLSGCVVCSISFGWYHCWLFIGLKNKGICFSLN